MNPVMTPQLQLAIRMLSLSQAACSELLEAERARLGVLRHLGDHEEDPLETAERATAEEEGRAPWLLSRVRLIDSQSTEPDVWVTGTPPVAAANGSGPRFTVIDEADPAVNREATWLLMALRQRLRTFERVAAVAVAANHDYFAGATDEPTRLSIREVAQGAGLHESTIERVAGAGLIQSARGFTRFDELIGRSTR